MTTIEFNELPATRRQRTTPLAWLGTVFDAWRQHRRRRRTMDELSMLDAHLLRDIGLSRDDLARAANGGPHRSIWLEPLSREPSATARDRYSP